MEAICARVARRVRRLVEARLDDGLVPNGSDAALARGFSDDEELVALTAQLLLISAVFQVFDVVNMIASCTLRGTGDVRFPAVVGTLLAWALVPPAMWLLGYHLGLGVVGGWIGLCAQIIIGALIFWLRVERLGWQGAAVRARAIREAAAVGATGIELGSPAPSLSSGCVRLQATEELARKMKANEVNLSIPGLRTTSTWRSRSRSAASRGQRRASPPLASRGAEPDRNDRASLDRHLG